MIRALTRLTEPMNRGTAFQPTLARVTKPGRLPLSRHRFERQWQRPSPWAGASSPSRDERGRPGRHDQPQTKPEHPRPPVAVVARTNGASNGDGRGPPRNGVPCNDPHSHPRPPPRPAALAQEPAAPTVEVTLDPEGEITVGTPVTVRLTVLVPTYMPQPPVWPDLQIADAITGLAETATHPVSRNVGGTTLAGVTRTFEIVPQRPAEFDLSGAAFTVTYADPDTNAPQEATLPVPDIALTATVPPGAEGLDTFLAAQSLTLTASIDGLPGAPKPGDAFTLTLTLTTTATGTPAMLLPPLLDRLPTPQGLRAYPREPQLTDTPGERGAPPSATRTEQTA